VHFQEVIAPRQHRNSASVAELELGIAMANPGSAEPQLGIRLVNNFPTASVPALKKLGS